jgi:hypothetical protein
MWHVWGRESCVQWGNLKEIEHLKVLGVGGRILLKLILKK